VPTDASGVRDELDPDDRLEIHEVISLHGHLCDAGTYERFDEAVVPGRDWIRPRRRLPDRETDMSVVADIVRLRESRHGSARSPRWSDLSQGQQAAVLALGSIEVALPATAAADLYRRPREAVHGPKALWWPALLVQPFGPIAYLLFGRR